MKKQYVLAAVALLSLATVVSAKIVAGNSAPTHLVASSQEAMSPEVLAMWHAHNAPADSHTLSRPL